MECNGMIESIFPIRYKMVFLLFDNFCRKGKKVVVLKISKCNIFIFDIVSSSDEVIISRNWYQYFLLQLMTSRLTNQQISSRHVKVIHTLYKKFIVAVYNGRNCFWQIDQNHKICKNATNNLNKYTNLFIHSFRDD